MPVSYVQYQFNARRDANVYTGTKDFVGLNTNWTPGSFYSSPFRLVFTIQATGSSGTSTTSTYDLYVQKNGAGGYGPIGGTSGFLAAQVNSDADQSSIGANTIGAGTGSWMNGFISNDGVVDTFILTRGYYTEVSYGIQIDWNNVNDGDYFDFHITRAGTALNTYTQTPRLTINKEFGVALLSGAGDFQSDGTIIVGPKSWDGAALFEAATNFQVDATILSGPPVFVTGRYDESGTVDNFALSNNTYSEFEFGLILDLGALQSGDTLDFRILADGIELSNYVTPRITLVSGIAQQGSAHLDGAGAFKGDATHTPAGSSLFTGAGQFKSDAQRLTFGTAHLDAIGSFAADASILHYVADCNALLSGAGLFAADATISHYIAAGAALFSGIGSVGVNARLLTAWPIAALFTGTGQIAVDARLITTWQAAALFTGYGGLKVTGSIETTSAAFFAGTGSLKVSAYRAYWWPATAWLTGAGSFKADAELVHWAAIRIGEAKFEGTGKLSADLEPPDIRYGKGLLAGAGQLKSRAVELERVASKFAGLGLFKVGLVHQPNAAAKFDGAFSYKADATVLHYRASGAALFAGAYNVAINVSVLHYRADGTTKFEGTGGLKVDTVFVHWIGNIAARFAPESYFYAKIDPTVHQQLSGAAKFTGAFEFKASATVDQYKAAGIALLAGAGGCKVNAFISHVVLTDAAIANFAGGFKAAAYVQHYVAVGAAKFDGAFAFKAAALFAGGLSKAHFDGIGLFKASARTVGRISIAAQFDGRGALKVSTQVISRVQALARFDGVGSFAAARPILKASGFARFHPIGDFKVDATVYWSPNLKLGNASFIGFGLFKADAVVIERHYDEEVQGSVIGQTDLHGTVEAQKNLGGTVSSAISLKGKVEQDASLTGWAD